MNQEQIQQAARDEALVPIADRQFWFTVKKIKKTTFYEFDLGDKKCKIDVELFRKILDFQYQIDYRQSKLRRCEIMPYPRFTKIIINYFLLLHKSIAKGLSVGLNTIKDDSVIKRLKFVNKGKDYQEYGRTIPDMMLTDEIKQSEAYKAFIGYSTDLIPPKKSKGKGSQGKKQTVTPKKKSSIFTDDNIIHEPDVALELGKSISKTEAEIAKEASRVHETHKRLVTEKLINTLRVSKNKSLDQSQKLKEVPDEVKGSSAAKADATIDWGSENESDYSEEEKVYEEEIEWVSTC
ncbi:hypothetical protein Tco_0436332 [Tanacetum coccineum]